MYPTGPMLAFQLNIPEIFSEALASPAYMVATPMLPHSSNLSKFISYLAGTSKSKKFLIEHAYSVLMNQPQISSGVE